MLALFKKLFIPLAVLAFLTAPMAVLHTPVVQAQINCDDLVPGTTRDGGTCLPENTDGFGLTNIRSVSGLLIWFMQVLLAIVGVIAIIFVIIGGYRYIVSAGGDTAEAKNTILNALIGLVIVLISLALVRIVANLVTNAGT